MCIMNDSTESQAGEKLADNQKQYQQRLTFTFMYLADAFISSDLQ